MPPSRRWKHHRVLSLSRGPHPELDREVLDLAQQTHGRDQLAISALLEHGARGAARGIAGRVTVIVEEVIAVVAEFALVERAIAAAALEGRRGHAAALVCEAAHVVAEYVGAHGHVHGLADAAVAAGSRAAEFAPAAGAPVRRPRVFTAPGHTDILTAVVAVATVHRLGGHTDALLADAGEHTEVPSIALDTVV